MSEISHRAPLLNWLIGRFEGQELSPPRNSLETLSDVAERLVPLYLGERQPLRPAAVARKLATLSRNLGRAAKRQVNSATRAYLKFCLRLAPIGRRRRANPHG